VFPLSLPPAVLHRIARGVMVVSLSISTLSVAHAQSLIEQATPEQLISLLTVNSKAYRPTAAPNAANRVCPEVANAQVMYADDGAAAAQLNVNFATNSDRIQPSSHMLLDSLARALNSPSLGQATVAIAGHTDATGDHRNNQILSCARAIAVRNALIQRGVAAERMGAYGFGPDRPLQSSISSKTNRRVEIRRAN
jgi:outer membrane protein OmpA-like peptidoglycan-associated protein